MPTLHLSYPTIIQFKNEIGVQYTIPGNFEEEFQKESFVEQFYEALQIASPELHKKIPSLGRTSNSFAHFISQNIIYVFFV